MGLLWDDIANGQVVISFPHHEIHDGDSFMASYRSPDGSDIDDNANLDITIMPVTGMNIHWTFEVSAGGDAEISLYEGTVTHAGTAIQEYNMNRASAIASNIFLKYGPDVESLGTRILNSFLPGGIKNQATGGTARAGTEFILAAATKYLLRVTNRAGSGKPMGVQMQWYEKAA